MVCQSSLVCGSTFYSSYVPPHMASNSGNLSQHAAHQASFRHQKSNASSISNGQVLQNHRCDKNTACQEEDVKYSSRIKCYVCDIRVDKKYLSRHLYFGKLKCRDCGLIVNDCESFYSSFESSDCEHKNVAWSASKTKSPIEFLKEKLRKKYKNKNIDYEVLRYARKLEDLKYRSPWKVVLHEIRKRKSFDPIKYSTDKAPKFSVSTSERKKNISPKNNFTKYNISSSESSSSESSNRFSLKKQRNIKKGDKRDLKKKKTRMDDIFGRDSKPNSSLDKMVFGKSQIQSTAETTVEYLELPSDGKYLIIQESIEECPMCYSPLRIDNCIVYISLMYYKFFCECGIKFFFIPKTPENVEHPITILNTDSASPLLMQKKGVFNTQKRKKKEMRIKTTSDLLR